MKQFTNSVSCVCSSACFYMLMITSDVVCCLLSTSYAEGRTHKNFIFISPALIHFYACSCSFSRENENEGVRLLTVCTNMCLSLEVEIGRTILLVSLCSTTLNLAFKIDDFWSHFLWTLLIITFMDIHYLSELEDWRSFFISWQMILGFLISQLELASGWYQAFKFYSNLTFQLTILLSFNHFYAVKACGVVNLNFYEIFKHNTRVRKKNIMCKSEGKFVLSTCKSRRRSLIEIDLNNFTTSINISWNAMWDIQT